MGVKFPIIIYERDDQSLFVIKDISSLQTTIEVIDVENNEYLAWDSRGVSVGFTIEDDKIGVEVCSKDKKLIPFLQDKLQLKDSLSNELDIMLFLMNLLND